jgi:hypothetical protein
MKIAAWPLLINLCLLLSARADLTVVQKLEGVGPISEMSIKIKGDKARVDATSQFSTIVDAKTGEIVTLLHDQKKVVRVSAEKAKAAAEMVAKFNEGKEPAVKPKLVPTGKKETVNGYEADIYTFETPQYKATYWVAAKYPDAQAILAQMQTVQSEVWKASNQNQSAPDFRDLPGVPLKTVLEAEGRQLTTTLVSIKQDPISDADFSLPQGYEEMKMPEINLDKGAKTHDKEKKPSAQSPSKP